MDFEVLDLDPSMLVLYIGKHVCALGGGGLSMDQITITYVFVHVFLCRLFFNNARGFMNKTQEEETRKTKK